MTTTSGRPFDAEALLAAASVHPDVHRLRPDYAALLLVAEGLTGGPTDADGDAALRSAEQHARSLLDGRPVDEIPQVVEWRDAYRGFGVKPRLARSSMEALLRRAADGLPRVDRLTDTYNAVSVLHLLPVGGEDLARYAGPPRLAVAAGDEPFETAADGRPVTHTVDPGEVIWRDDLGVTCRRWNWRQCRRTRLGPTTTRALFVVDALGATGPDRLYRAAEDLTSRLLTGNPGATFVSRLLSGPSGVPRA